jgi:hypothetical protein
VKIQHIPLFKVYAFTIGIIFLACFLFFNFDYRYIDDYRIFLHNSTIEGFLNSSKWGFSRIVGNYFFGLLYLPQNNVFLNVSILAIHCLNGFLIYKILRKSGSVLAAFFAGLSFVSLPITSEAFFWGIAGQVVYAVMFFLTGVLYYQSHQENLRFRDAAFLVTLLALSISFYEVFLMFPFIFLLFCIWRRKHIVLSAALSITSAGYLGLLKLVTYLAGGNITAQQKTNMIAFQDIPDRVIMIIKDLFHVFVGKVSWTMYTESLSDAFKGAVPLEIMLLGVVFVVVSAIFIWTVQTKNAAKTTLSEQYFPILTSVFIGCSLGALLTLPVNYFHDLRTFYPFTISLILSIGYLLSTLRSDFLRKVLLTVLSVFIIVNILVLKIENNQYVQIYKYDRPFIDQLEKDHKAGLSTIIYIPGYNSQRPLETQMNLAYYPETNFIYGTHMLTASSIRFTRTPYQILGNREEIETKAASDSAIQRVYDFVERKTVPMAEFLSTSSATAKLDLTKLDATNYLFQDVQHDLKKYDAAVIYQRKLLKTFVTHPNCGEKPATLILTTPQLTKTCSLSFRLLNVKDVERRTISDGVEFKLHVNGTLRDTVKLESNNPTQAQKLYRYEVSPQSIGSAQLRFEVTDGGQRNCNDDKIFIAEPVLACN